ncbi:cytochrome b5 [Roridomyces roridus]|uniref:Cytochrome b5 n=1 Tax=Roridomyces roridus TaxID=1738132 RepID=A0AAD7FK31_9AGAR|nr:cytochrome b5 [Roridomyces roridus]
MESLKYALVLVLPVAYLAHRYLSTTPMPPAPAEPAPAADAKEPAKSVMSAPRDDLAPPKDDPFTQAELAAFDGSDPSKPIYVSIKGTVFDVTHKAEVYGPGKSYSIFAGKDGSRGLGLSSLNVEDAVPDYSPLDAKHRQVLDDWHAFFLKRYNIMGRVTDLPEIQPARRTT